MGTYVVGGVLIVIVIAAIISSAKHFKGEGGCCGGGGSVEEYKELEGEKLGEMTVYITGMHCDNCKNRIEHAVNRLEGAVCKVHLRKNLAIVSYSKPIDEKVLKDTIEELGFEVTEIKA